MERKDVENKYKWKVEDIFPSDEAWEKSFSQAEKMIDFSEFEGKLGDRQIMVRFTQKDQETSKKLERLHLYAHMRHDEDTRIAKYTAMQSRAMSLIVKYSSAIAFVQPELTALPEETLKAYAADPALNDYDYFFRQIIKDKPHILSAQEEKLLAMGGEVYSQFQNVFSMIDNADIQLGEVTDSEGNTIALTQGV